MLFSSRNSYYPKMRKLKKFRRRKKTINFRISPILNTFSGNTLIRTQNTNPRSLRERYRGTEDVGVLD